MLLCILEIGRDLVKAPLCTIHLLVDGLLMIFHNYLYFDVIHRDTANTRILGLVVLTHIP